MRLFKQKATYVLVGVLTIFGMSHFAYASDMPDYNSSLPTVNINLPVGTECANTPTVCVSFWNPTKSHGYTTTWAAVDYSQDGGNTWQTVFPKANYLYNPINVYFAPPPVSGYIPYNSIAEVVLYDDSGSNATYVGEISVDGSGNMTVLNGNTALTHIIDFQPENGTTTPTNSVFFSLTAYIASKDVGTYFDVDISLQNLDQNTVISGLTGGAFSNVIMTLYQGEASTSGVFYFSTTTVLSSGNYMVTASLNQVLNVPLIGALGTGVQYDFQQHQFIVVSSTYLGNLSQNAYDDIGAILGSLPATTTAVSASTCNPLEFDVVQCMTFLFVPSPAVLNSDMQDFYNGFLERYPWGYVTRFFALMSGNVATTLPQINFPLPSNFPSDIRGVTLSLNPWEAFQSDSILSTATSSDGKTIWSTVTPIWDTVVLFAFAVAVFHELIGFVDVYYNDGSTYSESDSDTVSVNDGVTHIKSSRSINRRRRLSRRQYNKRRS